MFFRHRCKYNNRANHGKTLESDEIPFDVTRSLTTPKRLSFSAFFRSLPLCCFDCLVDPQGASEEVEVDLEAGGGHLFNRGFLHIRGDVSFREGISGTEVRPMFFLCYCSPYVCMYVLICISFLCFLSSSSERVPFSIGLVTRGPCIRFSLGATSVYPGVICKLM